MSFDKANISRADLLRGIAGAPIAIGAFAAMMAEADAKSGSTPKSAVQYQTSPKGGAACGTCKFFIKGKSPMAGACTVVAGTISAKGWCAAYSKGSNSANKM